MLITIIAITFILTVVAIIAKKKAKQNVYEVSHWLAMAGCTVSFILYILAGVNLFWVALAIFVLSFINCIFNWDSVAANE